MSKFNKLAALNEIAEQLEQAGHSTEAALVHNQFMKLAQMADEEGMSMDDTMDSMEEPEAQVHRADENMYYSTKGNSSDSVEAFVEKIQRRLGVPEVNGRRFGPTTTDYLLYLIDGYMVNEGKKRPTDFSPSYLGTITKFARDMKVKDKDMYYMAAKLAEHKNELLRMKRAQDFPQADRMFEYGFYDLLKALGR
jgi:hypothetical protein